MTSSMLGLLALGAVVYASPSCDSIGSGYQCQTDISQSWGMYSPYFRVPSEIPDVVPDDCTVTFVQVLQRHGARYPTKKKSAKYKATIEQVQANSGGSFTGKYAFLADYSYELGADDLTVFGQKESRNAAVEFYERYDHLARRHTPFVRASSEDRVVLSALNWTQGFHEAKAAAAGPVAIENPFPIGILQLSEADGQNNTLDPSTCPAFEDGWASGIADAAQAIFLDSFISPIQARLNRDLLPSGDFNLTAAQTVYMMDMCPFDTVASDSGAVSPFCALFSADEWQKYDYYESLNKYYGQGWGNVLGAAQGVGFVNELVARLTQSAVINDDYTTINTTLDSNGSATFPVDEATHPIFADFSHDNPMTSIFSALGLYNRTMPLSNTTVQTTAQTYGYSAAWTVPFAGRAYIEKQQCTIKKGGGGGHRNRRRERYSASTVEYVRVLVNGRVVPLQNCGADALGRCLLSDFVDSLSFAQSGGNWGQCYE